MNYFQLSGQRICVDDDGTCVEHERYDREIPLFHRVVILRRPTDTVRCPRSLSPEERKKLKEGK